MPLLGQPSSARPGFPLFTAWHHEARKQGWKRQARRRAPHARGQRATQDHTQHTWRRRRGSTIYTHLLYISFDFEPHHQSTATRPYKEERSHPDLLPLLAGWLNKWITRGPWSGGKVGLSCCPNQTNPGPYRSQNTPPNGLANSNLQGYGYDVSLCHICPQSLLRQTDPIPPICLSSWAGTQSSHATRSRGTSTGISMALRCFQSVRA